MFVQTGTFQLCKDRGIFLIETKAHGGKVAASNGQLLVNGHEPEKDFIAQCLKNTFWLRDKVCATIDIEPWIVPVLVFTNAFVERMSPIKSVTVVNKKYLVNILQKQNSKAQNSIIWENREKILLGLHSEEHPKKRISR